MGFQDATPAQVEVADRLGISLKGVTRQEAVYRIRDEILREQYRIIAEKDLHEGDRVQYIFGDQRMGEILEIVPEERARTFHPRSSSGSGSVVSVRYDHGNGRVQWVKPKYLEKIKKIE